MRVNQCFNSSVAEGQTIVKEVVNQKLNSLLFSKKNKVFSDDDRLTVVLRDEVDQIILVNRVSMNVLAAVSDLQGGASRLKQSEMVESSRQYFALDLNYLDTCKSGVLEISLSCADATEYAMYTCLEETKVDMPLRYILTNTQNEVFPDVEALYLVNSGSVPLGGTVIVRTDDSNDMTSVDGLRAFQTSYSDIEIYDNDSFDVVLAFESEDIPERVHLELQDVGSTQVLHVQKVVNLRRVNRSTYKNSCDLMRKIENVENDATKAKALRHAGILQVKSQNLRPIVSKLRASAVL